MLALVKDGVVHFIPLQAVHFKLIRTVQIILIYPVHLKVIWAVHLNRCNHVKTSDIDSCDVIPEMLREILDVPYQPKRQFPPGMPAKPSEEPIGHVVSQQLYRTKYSMLKYYKSNITGILFCCRNIFAEEFPI